MSTIIKCIVADKRVVEVVRMLKPFALDPPVVDPMDESPAKKIESGKSIRQMVFEYVDSLVKSGVKKITARELRKFCVDRGAQENSYSYALKLLVDEGRFKKTKTASLYEVVK